MILSRITFLEGFQTSTQEMDGDEFVTRQIWEADADVIIRHIDFDRVGDSTKIKVIHNGVTALSSSDISDRHMLYTPPSGSCRCINCKTLFGKALKLQEGDMVVLEFRSKVSYPALKYAGISGQ